MSVQMRGKSVSIEDVGTVYSGDQELFVQRAVVDCITAGDNELIAAVVDKTIVVLQLWIQFAGAVDVYFNDGVSNLCGGTRKLKFDNSGAAGLPGILLPFNPKGYFEAAGVNRPINMNLSAGVGAAGCLTYVLK